MYTIRGENEIVGARNTSAVSCFVERPHNLACGGIDSIKSGVLPLRGLGTLVTINASRGQNAVVTVIIGLSIDHVRHRIVGREYVDLSRPLSSSGLWRIVDMNPDLSLEKNCSVRGVELDIITELAAGSNDPSLSTINCGGEHLERHSLIQVAS